MNFRVSCLAFFVLRNHSNFDIFIHFDVLLDKFREKEDVKYLTSDILIVLFALHSLKPWVRGSYFDHFFKHLHHKLSWKFFIVALLETVLHNFNNSDHFYCYFSRVPLAFCQELTNILDVWREKSDHSVTKWSHQPLYIATLIACKRQEESRAGITVEAGFSLFKTGLNNSFFDVQNVSG